MTHEESVRWFEDNGGTWMVRATTSACAVVAWLGSQKVVAESGQLTTEGVDRALIEAISQIQQMVGMTF
jgi:hypothetical protein